MKPILVASLVAACLAAAPVALRAAEQPADKPAETQKAPKAKTRPYKGTIKAFDKTAMSFTLEGEKGDTICITSQTRVFKDGQPATTDAIVAGEQVRGSARQTAEGKWEAVSVYLGKPGARKGQTGEKGKGPEKKQGQPETK
jgi:Cu/Ag efflux protein CusF